ncbi:MAG TPA: hypothetical protein PLL64_09085, partial [Rhodothermales bacterium]|nr:hypothetical protein [Rhodothermales bacterium]
IKYLFFLLVLFVLPACQDDPVKKYEGRNPKAGIFLEQGKDLMLKNDTYMDAETGKPYTGEIKGAIPQDVTQRMDAKMKNGKFEGEYKVYFTENGKEFLRLKRTYKNGIEVGTTTKYYSDGKVLAEFKYNDQGKLICSVNYDKAGKKTFNNCIN